MENTKRTIIDKYESLASIEDRYRKAFFIIEKKVETENKEIFQVKDLKEFTGNKYSNMAEVAGILRNNNLIEYNEAHLRENPKPYSLVEFSPIDSSELTKEELIRLFRAATGILRNINCEKYFLYMAMEKYYFDSNLKSAWRKILSSKSSFRYIAKALEDNQVIENIENSELESELNLYSNALIQLFNTIEFNSVDKDVVSESLENLFGDVSLADNKNSFYTPKEVNELVSKLIDIEPESAVMDFAAGTGALLSAISKENVGKKIEFYAVEKDERVKELCYLNLNGLNKLNADIKAEDSLLYSSDDNFDYVITNPPWNLTEYDKVKIEENEVKYIQQYEGVKIYPVKNSADVAFIQLATYYADKKAVIIIDSAFLSRAGNEKRLRKWLIEKDILETVIFLPEKIFYNTAFTGAILIINKQKPADKKVRFINAESFCTPHPYRKNILLLNNIDKIVEIYNDSNEIKGISQNITHTDINYVGHDLNIFPYLKEETKIDVQSSFKKLIDSNHQYTKTLDDIKLELKKYSTEKFSDISTFTRGENYKASELSVQSDKTMAVFKSISVDDIKFIPSALVNDESKIIKAGDILVNVFGTNKENLGKTLLITEEMLKNLPEKATVSSTLAILRLNKAVENISPEYLEQVINSEKFKQHCNNYFTTSNISNISKQIIDKFQVPVPPSKEELKRITELLSGLNILNEEISKQISFVTEIKNGIIQELY